MCGRDSAAKGGGGSGCSPPAGSVKRGGEEAGTGWWWFRGGGGKRVCEKCELALASGTCNGGKGRLKVNSRDGIAAATSSGALGWPSFEDGHGWGGWLAGDGGGNRGANEELAPGTPGPDRCPTGLVLVPITDGPMASSREGESWPALNRMKGAGGAM